MTTIVRVKRHRTDDPVEALVLSCKRKKTEELDSDYDLLKKVFNFSGTVQEKDDEVAASTVESFNKESKYSNFKKAHTPEIRLKQRKEQKERSENNRFTLLSCLRSSNTAENSEGETPPDSKENYTIVDVVSKDSNQKPVEHDASEGAYVYDLYSIQENDSDFNDFYMENLLSIQPLETELEYRNGEDCYEEVDPDEDDSNDENNWRNDYPDTDSRYHHPDNSFAQPYEKRYKKRRNISFHGRYDRSEHLRSKSSSLNAILEELYTLGPEDHLEEGKLKFNYGAGGSLIPRIKLKRSTSSLNEERTYKPLRKMSSETEIFLKGDSTMNIIETNVVKSPEHNISILLNDEDISRKSNENYFAKNFDDCMKRLQLIEKEHELIEKDEDDLQFPILSKEKGVLSDPNKPLVEETCKYKIQNEFNNFANGLNKTDNEVTSETPGKPDNSNSSLNSIPAEATEDDGDLVKKTKDTSWYSNLKQQFEKRDQENEEQKTREMTCRITGATLKSQNENTKPEDKERDTRHYFSRLVKSNKTLLDEELPDPDKVKNIRAMFQENLNSTLKRKLDKKLGGSLQNISLGSTEQQMNRPLSAQCYRNDLFPEGNGNPKSDEEKDKTKPLRADGNGEFNIENTKKKLFEKYEKDLKLSNRTRRALQPKWTDTGSVSSGIGSDLSSYDTDLECYSREGTEQDEMTISDDDLPEEVKDKHYVQNEVLEKIRSFGTSVTYYGGEMITCSVGPLLSPTTQAIIEEIGEKYGDESSPVRSFDEFYRKYVETNEHARKKKLGRTRSFGQNDVFQKPNVLSNTEIEMYKNDLEIEIGIKKPIGMNTLKRKVTKSASLGCNAEEKPKEKQPTTTNPDDSKKNVSDVSLENEKSPENVTVNNNRVESSNCQFAEPEINNNGNTESQNKPTPNDSSPVKPNLQNEFSSTNSTSEFPQNPLPSNEILFSYEKTLFNTKPKPDMEFEEFEVCETLTEKLEKLEKTQDIQSNSEETPEKPFNDNTDSSNTEKIPEPEILEKTENTPLEKKESKLNHSRWPIETSVMVDIQKNNEQTPKLITTGKTVAKTKIRLF